MVGIAFFFRWRLCPNSDVASKLPGSKCSEHRSENVPGCQFFLNTFWVQRDLLWSLGKLEKSLTCLKKVGFFQLVLLLKGTKNSYRWNEIFWSIFLSSLRFLQFTATQYDILYFFSKLTFYTLTNLGTPSK